jgi:hypothetical protein
MDEGLERMWTESTEEISEIDAGEWFLLRTYVFSQFGILPVQTVSRG